MSRSYRFTRDALEDLLAIWLYTDERWGEEQADRYQDELHDACQRVADGEGFTSEVEGKPEVRYHHCGRHFIFYVQSKSEVVVIAVLHERMDLPARLAKRLKGGA
ncbi:type II toxin-antitoxin system RelE/ParE family toxin [Mameliella alba]|uniref:type II toxin-antitoxin system RelE/ParE family toxin n=1 Tax=Mameliella alba TaxID=561184 RepID=UPI000B5341BA|nr:type II toxin-antitoxin system RelE/ParE family toxin [Mameliella alba]OWV39202.1 plasmid stabilization protein [Mameliella alba]